MLLIVASIASIENNCNPATCIIHQINSMDPTFKFKSGVWLWQGKAAWHFITLPVELSARIKSFDIPRKGFGSMPVQATIGKTTWKTSIFPEKKGTYILPLKADVRKKEGIIAGKDAEVSITLQ